MNLSKIQHIINIVAVTAVFVALYLVFVYVPNERLMGPVQRIFYFHVPCAIASYCSIAVMFFSSIWLIARNRLSLGPVILAASEVAFIFSSITLLTGMIWGNAAWNTPFRFEPRLVSFLLLWLILLSTQIIKFFFEGDKLFVLAAVFGIVAALSIPLVVYSVKLLPAAVQLHPQVLGNRGLEFPGYKQTFLLSMFAVVSLQFSMLLLRVRLALAENRLRWILLKRS